MLVVNEEEEGELVEREVGDAEEDILEKVFAMMELSQTTVVGFTNCKTLKLMDVLKGKPLVILIDSGATHNFITVKIVKEMGVEVREIGYYSITVGDGRKIYSKEECPNVEIELQGIAIKQTFYPFNLENVDMVLGIAWLKSLGETKVNWRQMYMKVKVKKKWYCLKGDPTLTHTQVSFKSIKKALKSKGEGFLLEVKHKQLTEDEQTAAVTDEIHQLLKEYSMVCEPLKGLPPHRSKDHSILVKEGAQPPNVRPYRYAHAHKTEIEKLVKEMPRAGIIRPSNSLYSSPALLVKKKDGI